MTLPGAMRALAESWDDVIGRITGEQGVVLRGLVSELLRSQGVDRRDAALEIMELLMPVLPVEHPVRRAFATESAKLDRGSVNWDAALADLRPHLSVTAAAPPLIGPGGGPGTPDQQEGIRREVERWLLAAPTLGESEVRRRGADPQDRGLIRLRLPGDDVRLPAFQFGADGRPHPVVVTINLLLDAHDDPWGVADWWLGGNAWIGAVPADVIGSVDDQVLIEAARAVFEEA
jgi:hypothetical protein